MAMTNVADLLSEAALRAADTRAFGFASGGDCVEEEVSYGELWASALAIGDRLRSSAGAGQRALLFYPPGLGFIRAFFGCLVSGVAAVPLAPPRRRQSVAGLRALVADCSPSVVLCAPELQERLREWFAELPELLSLPWLACGEGGESEGTASWSPAETDPASIALLQYTSGTTALPKGVMVSHANLLANLSAIQRAFGTSAGSRGVFWLPFYHDMGLIGGVLQTVYCGGSSVFLPPTVFVQHPLAWLQMISRTRATIGGGPDFAYRLCVQKFSPAACADLDLASWELAFTGAEPVRGSTLDLFAETFAAHGFRRRCYFPCYGLAEATLLVAGGPRPCEPKVLRLDADALAEHRALDAAEGVASVRSVVGCGESMAGHEIAIVDPESCLPCPPDRVGEVWVSGPSVAGGYFGQPEVSEATFRARLADRPSGTFLRTGDLGFVRDGQLFLTGRRKDLIIVRGRNYYPDAIEEAVQGAHGCFRPGHCVAVSVEGAEGEDLVVVQEVEPRQREIDGDDALRRVREVVAGGFDLEVHAILLVRAGAIPKTTSGKIRRAACRDAYLAGELEIVAQWVAETAAATLEEVAAGASATAAEIEDWLVDRIAGRLRAPRERILRTTPFLEFGIGSLAAVQIATDLGRWLGRPLSPTAVYNYPTIGALASWLASVPSPTAQPVSDPLSGDALPDAERLLQEIQNLTEEEMNAYVQQEMAKPQGEARDAVPGA